jgi:hypothetical protein
VDPEQIARNDAIFREANERIGAAAQKLGQDDQVPFICECADAQCRDVVRLTLREYEDIRSSPTRFFVVPEHEGEEASEVVARRPTYLVIEKVGLAAEVAAELDPRTD